MKRVLVLAVAFGAVGIASAFVWARPVDARLAACGVTDTNRVSEAFDIPAASRIWEFVPGLEESPELSADGRPAFVVLFAGSYAPIFGGPIREGEGVSAPTTYQNVMCVVLADGEVIIYADVSRVGLKLP